MDFAKERLFYESNFLFISSFSSQVTMASVSFSMVLLQWFKPSKNILRMGSGLYSGL
jgi:hypothetical protein